MVIVMARHGHHDCLSCSLIILVLFLMLDTTSGVPCFCTESRCTYGYCESAWCLVGIKHNGRVVRTCGSQSSQHLQPCRQDVGDWQDVCSCTTPYCNTFAYLRYEMRWMGHGVGTVQLAAPDQVYISETGAWADTKKEHDEDSDATLERTAEHKRKNPGAVRQAYLVVVLVVAPLVVAGTAVIIVIGGYYCKMC